MASGSRCEQPDTSYMYMYVHTTLKSFGEFGLNLYTMHFLCFSLGTILRVTGPLDLVQVQWLRHS